MPDSLLAQVLVGLYLGALTGVLPALVSWTLGFSFRYVTGVTVPGLAVVVVGAALAGVSGGLLGLLDPAISETPVGVVASLIVLMACLWAHNQGDKTGAEFPRRITVESIRRRTLSADVIDRVGRFRQVRVRVRSVEDVEGYPPLSEGLREELLEERFTLPADLPLSELETRVRDRLRSNHDLAAVTVSLDRRADATVAAAPALGGFSRRVPAGRRAVSVTALLPAGADRGDRVRLVPSGTPDDVEGTVLGIARPDEDGDEDEGRLTVAVSPGEVEAVLAAEEVRVTVLADDSGAADLLARLTAAGLRVRAIGVGGSHDLDPAGLRAETGAQILAIRRNDRRAAAGVPAAGRDEVLALGTPDALGALREALA